MHSQAYMLLQVGGHYRTARHIRWALVDVADYTLVRQHRWSLIAGRYVGRYVDGRTVVYLHRELLGLTAGDGLQGDHINHDKLDNRRVNLRVTTPSENGQNRMGPHRRNGRRTSRFRGVRPNGASWVAEAILNHRRIYIGSFGTEQEANDAAVAWRREHMPFSEMDKELPDDSGQRDARGSGVAGA